MSTVTVKIPPAFYDDHVSRDLPAGTETHRTLKSVTVDLTASELAELRSDAQHYADSAEEYWQEQRGLVISARATLRALADVTAPEPDPVAVAVTDAASKVARQAAAKLEARDIKAWEADGAKPGLRPATPNLDAINAEHDGTAGPPLVTTGKRTLREVPAGTTLPSGHLAPGALGASVAEHIAGHPDVDHGVGEVAKALGGKSAGAVRNALDRLVTTGAATLTSEKPRRYQAAAATAVAS